MLEHIPSSIKVTIIENGTQTEIITANDINKQFRNQLIGRFFQKELLENITLRINNVKYAIPYTENGMSVDEFFKHVEYCVDLHLAFFSEEKT